MRFALKLDQSIKNVLASSSRLMTVCRAGKSDLLICRCDSVFTLVRVVSVAYPVNVVVVVVVDHLEITQYIWVCIYQKALFM